MKRVACVLCAACLILAGCGTPVEETGDPPVQTDDPPVQGHVHNLQSYIIDATCEEGAKRITYCTECGERWEETVSSALGHLYSETSDSPSGLKKCVRPGCFSGEMPQSDRIYDEAVMYTFDDAKRTEIDGYYRAIEQAIEAAGAYSPNATIDYGYYYQLALNYNAYSAEVNKLSVQYRYAQLRYNENSKSEKTRADYAEIAAYYTENISRYYVMYSNIYDSAYRDYFFGNFPAETVDALVSMGRMYGAEEYVSLQNRNNEILLEYRQLADVSDESVPTLYAEYVSNYNALARLYGYENYPDYAYANVYGRDYTYRDVSTVADYIKQYFSPIYTAVNSAYNDYLHSGEWTQGEIDEYTGVLTASFFENTYANDAVNGYFEGIETKGAKKVISFATELQTLIKNGAYFLADSEQAYTVYLESLGVPFLLLGPGSYRSAFTVVHEFGHYFNYIYNGNAADSYDLKETHSQGNEALFLAYLKDNLSERAYRGVLLYQLQYALNVIIAATAVDMFEIAVYAGEYTGTGSEKFLADGTITPDEYDELYTCILSDFGFDSGSDYWRRTVFANPCYYISYSLSRTCSLQLLVEAETNSFESALNKYLKLFTYTDSEALKDYRSVLEYAGLYDYNNERLYGDIYRYIASVVGESFFANIDSASVNRLTSSTRCSIINPTMSNYALDMKAWAF